MVKEKKRHRVLKVLLWFVLGIVVLTLILCVIFHKWLFAYLRLLGGLDALDKGSEGMTYTERTLTTEQMLKDFDFLYDTAVTNSLTTAQWEKYLKIDYEELYNTFRPRIESCTDEYEFLAVMTSFMTRLPGGHNFLAAPTDQLKAELDFPLMWELGYDDVIKTNYDFWVQIEDRMWSYDQKAATALYYGGDYVFINNNFGNEQFEDIINGKLLTLNGEPIDTAIRKLDTFYTWSYDSENDRVRVYALYFNDNIGDEYEAEIEMPDGSIVRKTLYNSAKFNVAAYYKNKLYPNHGKEDEPVAETTAATEVESPSEPETESTSEAAEEPEPKTYSIVTDKDRKLVFIRTTTCLSSEIDMVYEDLTAAIDEIDAENIIVDVRSNGGGDFNFVTEGLCRAIFDKPVGWINYARFPKADIPMKYLDFLADSYDQTPEDKGNYMVYYQDYTANGEAKKKFNIYVLISDCTFSSGDIFTAIAAEQDNVTIIGENTSGEGFSGNPLNYYLPESKFSLAYAPGVSEHLPENNILGTAPDIYCPLNWESVKAFLKLTEDPEISDKLTQYEYRALWDAPFRRTLELIDSRA